MRRARYGVLAGLLLLTLITYLDRVCISVASVRMEHDLGLTPSAWGIVLGAFTIAYGLFEVPTGIMGDRMGGRRVLTRIVVWWSVFTALTGTVGNLGAISAFWVLLVIRFLFGAGEAGAFPNISAVISRWFPPEQRARTMGLAWTASRVGGALSPLLVVPLQQRFGWRAAFFILGVVGIVWATIWFVYYRDDPRDMRGIRAAEIPDSGYPPISHSSAGLEWSKVLRQKNFWFILLMYHTYCWGSYFYISWMPTYLQKGRGFSESQMGLWATLPFILSGSTNFLGGWFSDRLVPRLGMNVARRAVGAGGLLTGGVLLAATAATPNNTAAACLLAASYGSMDAMLPVSWAVCMDVGGNFSGSVSASMNTAGQLGSFLSAVAFGFAVEWLLKHNFSVAASYNLPIFPMAGMLVISGLLFLKIDATRKLVPVPVV